MTPCSLANSSGSSHCLLGIRLTFLVLVLDFTMATNSFFLRRIVFILGPGRDGGPKTREIPNVCLSNNFRGGLLTYLLGLSHNEMIRKRLQFRLILERTPW